MTTFPTYACGATPTLFAWDVDHEAGVTGDRGKAIGHVHQALADAPSGTVGIVRRVAIGTSGSGDYIDIGEVGHARRDETSGAVIWQDA